MGDSRIALVTGAGSGIGRAVSLALQGAGYSVVLAGRRAQELERTAAMAREGGGQMLAVPADIGNPDAVRALFASTKEAFGRLQNLLGDATAYLIDTYDTLDGAHTAASLGPPLWGVRLDSGNLVELSREVRKILDDAGLNNAKIMATSDLNEYKILEFAAAGAPIDAFGVGTDLATSTDSPNLGVVYKLVELDGRFTAKFSEDKHTLPGAKQVFRFAGHDVIACSWECLGCGAGEPSAQALLRPVMLHGKLIEPLPTASAARQHAAESVKRLPTAVRSLFDTGQEYRVEHSRELSALYEKFQHENSLLRHRHAD